MTWEELFRELTEEEMEDADKDMEAILKVIEDPSYLMVKGDKSNWFTLRRDRTYYVEYIKKCFEEKGYVLFRASRWSPEISVISKRELEEKRKKEKEKSLRGDNNQEQQEI